MRVVMWVCLIVGSAAACSSVPQVAPPPGSAAQAPVASCGDLGTCTASCAPCRSGACSAVAARDCGELGYLHLRGARPQFDLASAADAFDVGCRANSMLACEELGLLVQDGRGVAWDLAKAMALYRRACDAGVAVGCFNLAIMYGDGNGVPRDLAKGRALMARAERLYIPHCNASDVEYCSNLGYLYEHGLLGTAEPARALAAYREGCARADHTSCANLTWFELTGTAMPENHAAAIARAEHDCAQGGSLSCSMLAYALAPKLEHPTPRVLSLLGRACDGGIPEACGSLSEIYAHGITVTIDPVKAGELMVRACDLGSAEACRLRGVDLQDAAEAQVFLLRACYIGSGNGCFAAANRVLQGEVAEGAAPVRSLAERGCIFHNDDACGLLRRLDAVP